MRPVPILMYHHINTHQGDIVTATPGVFAQQMKYLHEAGYRTLKIEELLSYVRGDLRLKDRAVVITFDDGWIDNYLYAFPVLKKYGFNAAVFIITDRTEMASEKMTSLPDRIPDHNESKALIGRGEAYKVVLNWELIGEMARSGLVEFYSHTKSHRKCDELAEGELLEELGRSKQVMEERLGRPCPYLCWPYGRYDQRAVRVARECGYSALFTVEHGTAQAGSDPFALHRILVKDKAGWFRRRMIVYSNPVLSPLYLAIKKK